MSKAKEDPPVVKQFKEYGKRLIQEMLLASPDGFVSKPEAYSKVVQGFKENYGWPSELTELERLSKKGEMREVYVNRLHWMTARLTSEKVTESVAGRKFIALLGKLDAANAAYLGKPQPEAKREAREELQTPLKIGAYTVDSILHEGCFLVREDLERLLERLHTKKNLILQGPPGTGKTWLAKRLAFALIGKKQDSKVRAVQFHPNLSYEDFVRGWRPTGEGKLSLADGVFMEAIQEAIDDPSSKFVVVIEEINRGNPAQIFGELLTLLEAGKRTPNEALELCYPDKQGNRWVHIPENLYVIGTMNIADRSLALVDLALRRRFAFVGLEPRLGPVWSDWVVKECGIDPMLVAEIERRIRSLNDQIGADARLGKQFRIGHSYVTPTHRLKPGDTKHWFRELVETEIGPLLEEYWFDAPEEAEKACKDLIQGW